MNTRIHIFIDGRVQGVGFRFSCQREARRLGITGWVKNRFDGRVETVAEGTRESVMQFLQWCRQGPIGAHVTECTHEFEQPTGEFNSFEITF